MDAVDASAHYEVSTAAETPSLLTIILDTNPRAWAALADTLSLSKAIANILVFVNSHLALSSTNQVAIIASHSNRAVWLYPTPPAPPPEAKKRHGAGGGGGEDGDVDMTDADVAAADPSAAATGKTQRGKAVSANKFPQFREIETGLLRSIRELVSSTTAEDLNETTTLLSGALTLALAHINKASLSITAAAAKASSSDSDKTKPSVAVTAAASSSDEPAGFHARILVISVSESSPSQYIPTMNAVFAASHAHVAIDVLSLRGSASFLQQAAFITRGTFLQASAGLQGQQQSGGHPQGLLSYLMLGFAASSSREDAASLVSPSADLVDFRAACFCHRRVVDTGFVCSICLSIFCEVPEGAECLTCGSRLALGSYGAKPAVVPRPRRKKKRRLGANGEEVTGSAAGTPRPG